MMWSVNIKQPWGRGVSGEHAKTEVVASIPPNLIAIDGGVNKN